MWVANERVQLIEIKANGFLKSCVWKTLMTPNWWGYWNTKNKLFLIQNGQWMRFDSTITKRVDLLCPKGVGYVFICMRPVIVHGITLNYVSAKFAIVVQPILFNFLISLTNKIWAGALAVFGNHFEFQMAALLVARKTHKSFVCPNHFTSNVCQNVLIQVSI